MKKILIAVTFMCAFSLTGNAQSNQQVLKSHKWFATGELGSKTITLSKTALAKLDWDAEFITDAVMQYGKTAKTNIIDAAGAEVKAGAHYTDTQYSYDVKGNVLHIHYQPSDWYYTMKSEKNGDLLLEETTAPSKVNMNTK